MTRTLSLFPNLFYYSLLKVHTSCRSNSESRKRLTCFSKEVIEFHSELESIDRGRIRNTTKTMSCNLEATLQLMDRLSHAPLVYSVHCDIVRHICFAQLTPVKTRYPLTSIT